MAVTAQDLQNSIAFDEPSEVSDGQGGTIFGWQERYRCRAHYRYLRGGETVQAARLEGRQPVIITVRASSETRQVRTEWRIRDTRTGTEFNIRGIVPTEDRRFLEITAESGVAI
jgi:SPP1 family predicted phage head-tail adaptor